MPVKIIDYCKIRNTSTEWVKQGYNFYNELPVRYKELVLGKIEKCSRLKNFLPHNNITIPTTIWQYLTNYRDQRVRGISLFYNLLTTYPTDYKNPHMLKWEKDLSQTFTGTQWRKVILIFRKASSCTDHWDNSPKNLNRWYLMPYRLSKIYPTASPNCWRCNDQIGNLHHTLWSCKNVYSFWNTVSVFLADLTGILMDLTPAMALLEINLDIYPIMYNVISF